MIGNDKQGWQCEYDEHDNNTKLEAAAFLDVDNLMFISMILNAESGHLIPIKLDKVL